MSKQLKTAILLTARLGSSRLPRKHLLSAGDHTMLGILAARIVQTFRASIRGQSVVVAIATSDEPENREFERFRSDLASIVYGAIRNIPLRHLQAAQYLGVENIVAVDGDDVLCSTAGMSAVRDALCDGAQFVKTTGLPFGMNVFGYTRQFLADALVGNESKILETGWLRIFDESHLEEIPISTRLRFPSNLRFTLDYPEDEIFFRALYEHFGDDIVYATDDDFIDAVIDKRLFEITDPIGDRYWKNFHAVRDSEIQAD